MERSMNMTSTITVSFGKRSLNGYKYYLKNKEQFKKKSVAIMLHKSGFCSLSGAIDLILKDAFWLGEPNKEKRTFINPETELKEGDWLNMIMIMGNLVWYVENGKLVRKA